ncbi:hypothetical protein H6P81_018189 [Aristolochia fimbriata]|uniref:Cysteine-rich receptor-like protein kinase 2 n=1 Tax=Aristolochia fimbriata TaxID=158543 RepID=A0AAV7E0A4_ARIFI|nr:hypothetical protein H6P81_018189 [Aristolochia fimbriata]
MKIRFRDPDFVFLVSFSVSIVFFFSGGVSSDPQTNLLNNACSQYNVSDPSDFFSNLNATFSDIRRAVASSSARFATGDRPRAADPVYVLFQCRDYLSAADCLACFSAAAALIRNCSAANGARVIYDGCFLRYESSGFYDQATLLGNAGRCGNDSAPTFAAAAATALLGDLVAATPGIEGYFAAAVRDGVYAVAQCARTVTRIGCGDCLKVAYGNIRRCLPETEGRTIDAGCFLRYSDAPFFGANQTIDLDPFLRKGGSNKKNAIIGGVAGGAGFVLLLLFALFLLKRSKTRKKTENERGDILGATELRGPVNFHYKDLKSATSNFSEENKLGEGGFGDVYMGLLKNGKKVAVKKLAVTQDRRVQANFLSEVKLISNVHHRNLVRLLGCCSKGPELLLVYEFMVNKSLDKFLFGDRSRTLNWNQRFDIIVGIARGLAYLHQEFHVCIIHRDIKSSNILLDDDLQAKIADFGLARLLPENQSHLTTKFAGTLGYTAPEYAIHGQLSEKVDTYGFGVVVLEIVSGRKSNDIKLEPVNQYLLEWAWNLYETGSLLRLVDEKVGKEEYRDEEMKKVIEIALLCTQSAVASRPTMSEIVVMLLSREGASRAPTRPTFIESTARGRGESSSSTTGSSSASNATVSISQISAR